MFTLLVLTFKTSHLDLILRYEIDKKCWHVTGVKIRRVYDFVN